MKAYEINGVLAQETCHPATPQALAGMLADAAARGQAVVPWGGGTQMGLGYPPRAADLVVATGSLNRLLEHSPADLTATVEAGMTLAELQRALAPHGQRVALEAPLPERATIGGILATGRAGPRRLRYGSPRDWVIGLTAALADGTPSASSGGTVAKSGGRVVKNVAGYDLAKLHIGGLGTLGIIVEASFKVLPLPETRTTVAAAFAHFQDSWACGRRLLEGGLQPTALELLNAAAVAHLGSGAPALSALYLVLAEFAGVPAAVARQEDEAARRARESGARSVTPLAGPAAEGLWREVLRLGGRAEDSPYLSTRATALAAAGGELFAACEGLGREHFLAPAVVGGLGTGVVQAHWWPAGAVPALAERSVRDIAGTLGRMARARFGALVVARAPPEVKAWLDVWGPAPPSLALMRALKQQFDPRGVLNPGRFVGRI